MTGLKYLHCCSFIPGSPILPDIHCFCNKIPTMFYITFENSMFMVPLLVIKSKTFSVQFLETLQANSNIEILYHKNEMPTYDPLNGYFMYQYMRFSPADYF